MLLPISQLLYLKFLWRENYGKTSSPYLLCCNDDSNLLRMGPKTFYTVSSITIVTDETKLEERWKQVTYCIFDSPGHAGTYPPSNFI
jgi:hypothetical protein